MSIDISVVILSWNDCERLQVCLESLLNSTTFRTLEILVVDNASTDGSPDMVESRFPNVKLIRNQDNLGFPKGNNIGINASQGRYVCLLNSDTKVLDGCLDALATYMDQHRDIGIIGPKILNADMTHQSSCREFPTLWNNFCAATGLARVFPNSKFFSGEHMFYFKGDRMKDVEVLVGCFWMVRREAISRFGLLDEGFFMYGEDLDWCRRCWDAGCRVTFFPGAETIHYRGGSSAKQDAVWVELTQQKSLLRYWTKYYSPLCLNIARAILILSRILRWGNALTDFVVRRAGRGNSRTRMRVNQACLQALMAKLRPGDLIVRKLNETL